MSRADLSDSESAGDAAAADALNWMRTLASRGKPVLFRGQSRVYPTILASLLRNHVSEADRLEWWSVLRRFVSARDGVTGYSVPSPHDALALVQHYLGLSPVIDLTGTPLVALYFAMTNQRSPEMRVVYAVEREVLERAGFVVSDHDFLALPFKEGGGMHRWLRQDGFTVGTPEWTDLSQAGTLDLASLPGVGRFTFRALPGDERLTAALGDLEAIEGDPLAAAVRGVFQSIARGMGCADTVQSLVQNSRTIDAEQLLIIEIKGLLDHARSRGMSDSDLAEIEKLLMHARRGHWDTSWSAALAYWKERVSGRSAPARL